MADTKRNKTGRMTSAESDYKKSEGKKLYVMGLSILNICELLGVGEKTIRGWHKTYGWEDEKELNNIRPSEIKKMILQYVLDVRNGVKSQYKADDLAKVSAAWDRLDDSRKKAVNAMETLDDFTNKMMLKAGQSSGKKREELLERIKTIRVDFDDYITELLTDD